LIGAGALVAAGGGLVLWPSRIQHRPKRELRVLDDKEFGILAAVATRTVGAPGADPIEIAHSVDETLRHAPPEVAADIKKLIGLFESAFAGFAFDQRLGTFTRMTPISQDAALTAWRDSRIPDRRAGYTALRKLTQAAYYSQPSSWESVGYPGPPQISGRPT
jgi:hypothetical protein